MMDHKIVCWADYAIPVPLLAKWMAMDNNGHWWAYDKEPEKNQGSFCWWTSMYGGGVYEMIEESIGITPPEPGPWDEQLYWIGD